MAGVALSCLSLLQAEVVALDLQCLSLYRTFFLSLVVYLGKAKAGGIPFAGLRYRVVS